MDDPRILIFPTYEKPESLREKYGLQLFHAKNPHMFAEAFVDTDKQFLPDGLHPGWQRRSLYSRSAQQIPLHGEVQPRKTDLVFTKSGDVLYVMVNNDYAFHARTLVHESGGFHPLASSFNAPKTPPSRRLGQEPLAPADPLNP